MCIQCVILGALINAGKYPKCHESSPQPQYVHFDVAKKIGKCDHKLTEASQILTETDQRAATYLNDTIAQYKLITGVQLVPLKVEADGSCLLHAISRGLVGSEIFYDCLRANLETELRLNEDWYRANSPSGILDDGNC